MTDALARLKTALSDRYTIERELGAGGMATVYLAEDLKHKRKVALKVLKPELAAVLGAERFVQEITTTAALQHPHILPLFDSGTADGFLYYVMPFIQGETLRSKLDRETQLGIDEAVKITTAVADALDYAHRQGVIHRDIKPENILLHEGRPMVADFGIALAVSAAAGGRMTETGLSLGTPHYMSPEQATAEKEISARSDVYSLGSVLYEMLTGNPPHTGASAQQIIMKIVTEEAAPVTKLRKAVPGNVAAAVAKSLEKLPADRFESAKAFAEALANPAYAHAAATGQGTGPRHRHLSAPWVTAALALITLVGGFLIGGQGRSDRDARPVQFHVGIPDGIVSIRRCCGQPLALSPDGQTLVFPGNTGAEAGALYRRELGRLSAERIPGTERGASPFFSPNGEWLGFETAGTLMKVRLAGGPVLKIAESGPVSSATWTDRDQIVFAVTGTGNHLWMVSAAGGQPVPIMGQDSTPVRGVPYPVALPGGRAVLSTGGGGDLAERRIVAVELETGRVDTIAIGTNAAYADGHLFIGGADGTLSVQPFDLAARKTTGEPIIILNGLARSGPWMLAFAVSAGGALAYEQAPVAGSFNQGQYSILMETSVMRAADSSRGSAAPAARNVPLPDPKPVGVFEPAISPDGRRVVYRVPSLSGTSMREAIGDLYLLDWQTGTTSRFTSGVARNPVWSRDGRHVTYSVPVGPASPGGIYSRAADLSGAPELIVRGQARPSSWTPDGRLLVTRGDNLTGNMDIGIVTPGDSAPRWIVQTPSNELNPVVSADGAWLGFVRESRIWLQPLDAVGEPVQISAELGMQPRWSRTGQTLYYISSPDNTLVRATLSGATVVGRETISTPMAALGNTVGSASWDIFPDGGRFIFVEQVPGGETPQLAVVWQWQALVRSMKGKQW